MSVSDRKMPNPSRKSLQPSRKNKCKISDTANSGRGSRGDKKPETSTLEAEHRRKGDEEKEEREEEKKEAGLAACQQRLLNCFRDAFYEHHGNNEDKSNSNSNVEVVAEKIQKVKQHLYHREFDAAFGKAEFREVYALRWSAGRAIGYLRIFERVLGERLRLRLRSRLRVGIREVCGAAEDGEGGVKGMKRDELCKIVCLGGGGGAELVALAGLLAKCASESKNDLLLGEEHHRVPSATSTRADESVRFHVNIVDIADWSLVIDQLKAAITSPPVLPAYASASRQASETARPLVKESHFEPHFQQHDLLSNVESPAVKVDIQEAWLVTIMFAMNELCHASFAKAHGLLSWLTANTRSGCLLLIVDSPGSYSSLTLKDGERKYPMRFYLDYALLGYKELKNNGGKKSNSPAWRRLVCEESTWLRNSKELEYPIPLEDMRVQIHLYEKE